MAYGFNNDKSKYELGDILGDFATIETGSTASRAYRQGHLVVYDRKLYRVISAIDEGDAFVEGTNIQLTNVGQEAPAVKYVVDTLSVSDIQTAWGNQIAANGFKAMTVNFDFTNDRFMGSIGAGDVLGGFDNPIPIVKGMDFESHGILCATMVSSSYIEDGVRYSVSIHAYNPESAAITIQNNLNVTLMFLKTTQRARLT